MTEIELKAHVADPAATERAIRAFAAFTRETTKRDDYWKQDEAAQRASQNASSIPADGAPDFFSAAMMIFTFIAALAAAVCVIAGASRTTVIMICLGASAFVAAASFLSWKKRLEGGTENRPETTAGMKDCVPGANAHPVKIRIREEEGSVVVTYKRKELQGDIEVNDEREFAIGERTAFESLIADLGFKPFIRKEKKTKSFSWKTEDGIDMTIELSLVAGLGWFIELEILAENPDGKETARARDALRAALARCGIGEEEIESRYYTDMLAESETGASGTATFRSHLPKQ